MKFQILQMLVYDKSKLVLKSQNQTIRMHYICIQYSNGNWCTDDKQESQQNLANFSVAISL